MSIKELKNQYKVKRCGIKKQLKLFKNLSPMEQKKEFIYCTLTPQSNAFSCWKAVEQISSLNNPQKQKLANILKKHARFHNNKARYLIQNRKLWNNVQNKLNKTDLMELREWLSENVFGYGMKEASHFLRNIGKSNNNIAILDRHILNNLVEYGVIKEPIIKNKRDYIEKERKYIKFANRIGIPPDELDLLLWSKENGSIFK